MTEKNGWQIWRRIGWVTGSIAGVLLVASLLSGIFLKLYVLPVVASKEMLEEYITKDVFNLTLKQFELQIAEAKKEISEMKKKVDATYALLLSMKTGGEM